MKPKSSMTVVDSCEADAGRSIRTRARARPPRRAFATGLLLPLIIGTRLPAAEPERGRLMPCCAWSRPTPPSS